MLSRLGLEFLGSAEVRDECQMDCEAVLLGKFPLELTDSLHERLGFHITDSSSDFGDYHVIVPGFSQKEHPALDFVSDVGNNLDGLSEIGPFAFLADDRVVNLSCGDIVRLRSVHSKESLVMSEVKVGFSPVFGHIALAVLVRIEGSRIDVNIGVKLLDCDSQTSGLKEFCQ